VRSTAAKLVRQRGWRRPRRRVHPEKPITGIRVTHPNEYWHIDLTVIRLVDDTKCYLHVVIDKFSRRILSWRLVRRLAPTTRCEIQKQAGKPLLDSLTQPEQLIDFYVKERSTQMPHHAFVR